jgi:hypothetical protein
MPEKEICQLCKEGYRYRDEFNHLTACTNNNCLAKFKGIWRNTNEL